MIVSASPMTKPFITGSEMKLARKPRRNSPATSANRPVTIASIAVNAAKFSGPPVVELGDRRGRERGARRAGTDDEMLRRAEQRVQHQRRRRRVQTDDRRDAGDRRVGERLGNEHRPQRETRDHVARHPRRW